MSTPLPAAAPADGRTFVHVAVHEGSGNALESLAAFREFQKGIRDRLTETPDVREATVVGSYRLLEPLRT